MNHTKSSSGGVVAANSDTLLRVGDAYQLLGVSSSTGYARQNPKSRYYIPTFPPRVYDAIGRPFVRLSDVQAYINSLNVCHSAAYEANESQGNG